MHTCTYNEIFYEQKTAGTDIKQFATEKDGVEAIKNTFSSESVISILFNFQALYAGTQSWSWSAPEPCFS